MSSIDEISVGDGAVQRSVSRKLLDLQLDSINFGPFILGIINTSIDLCAL